MFCVVVVHQNVDMILKKIDIFPYQENLNYN